MDVQFYRHCSQGVSTWGTLIDGAGSSYLKQRHLLVFPHVLTHNLQWLLNFNWNTLNHYPTMPHTARWGQINYKKKGASKIPSKSIISYPNRYVLWQKKNFCHRIRYSKFFLKFFHKKLVETTVCGGILTPVMGFYRSWPMFQNVRRPQLCTKGNNFELLLVKIGPESNETHFRSLQWLYVLMY